MGSTPAFDLLADYSDFYLVVPTRMGADRERAFLPDRSRNDACNRSSKYLWPHHDREVENIVELENRRDRFRCFRRTSVIGLQDQSLTLYRPSVMRAF